MTGYLEITLTSKFQNTRKAGRGAGCANDPNTKGRKKGKSREGGIECNECFVVILSLISGPDKRNAHADTNAAAAAAAVGEASRSDFNETIAWVYTSLRSRLRSEVRLLRVTRRGALRWRWRCRPDMWTVACRGRACTQFVSSSDNYAIMPGFLLHLADPAYRGQQANRPRFIRGESQWSQAEPSRVFPRRLPLPPAARFFWLGRDAFVSSQILSPGSRTVAWYAAWLS